MTTPPAIFRSRIVRYVFSGGTAAALNLVLTWLLGRTGLYYLAVVTVAFVASLLVSFSLQKFFTFSDTDRSRQRRQFAVFSVIAVFNLLVNDLLVYVQVDLLRLDHPIFGIDHLVLAQAIASVVIAAYSFFAYRIIFKQKPPLTAQNP